MNRTVAALLIVTVFVVTLIALTVLLVPLLLQQGSALISHIPGYFKRVQELIADTNLPWLSWLGSGDANETRFRPRQPGGHVAPELCVFDLDRRKGAGLVRFAS